MMKNLVNKFKKSSHENRRLIGNIVSLSFLQAANYILPLLSIPYLLRVIGPENFGILAFATATIMYICLVTDYGFNLSATRQISIERENKKRVSEIFSAVISVKLFLMLIGFFILIILIVSFEKFYTHREVYFATFGLVIGQVLMPVWLFQGLETMRFITYINIFSKLFFTVLVFVFVDDKSDYLLVPIFTSAGAILAGLWSLEIAISKAGVSFNVPNLADLKLQLTEGWHVFLSTIAISAYTLSTTLILGLFANYAVVGQFSAIEKIIQAAKGVYQPIAQAIYPLVGRKFKDNRIQGFVFMRKIGKIIIPLIFLLSCGIYVFSDLLVYLMFGAIFQDAVLLLKIMSPLPFIIALSNILGIQIMLNIGMKKAFTILLLGAAAIGVSLNLVLVPLHHAFGTAYAILMVEIFVAASMALYIKRNYKSTPSDVEAIPNVK